MPTKSKSEGQGKGTSRAKGSLPKAHVATIAVVVSDGRRRPSGTRVPSVSTWSRAWTTGWPWAARGRGGCSTSVRCPSSNRTLRSSRGIGGTPGLGDRLVAACAALKANGVEFIEGPKKEPWGWYTTVRDPDGNELFLMPDL